MKLIIAGSRTIVKYDTVKAIIEASGFNIGSVVCGGARGPDLLGKQYAEEKGIPIHMFPADWKRYGKRAGHLRNEEMGQFGDALLAIWDGKSSGTKGMINIMKKLNKPAQVFTIPTV